MPHFKAEESGAYREAAGLNVDYEKFINDMLEEHRTLYGAFNGFINAVERFNREEIVGHGKVIVSVLKGHIEKEEKVVLQILRKEGKGRQ